MENKNITAAMDACGELPHGERRHAERRAVPVVAVNQALMAELSEQLEFVAQGWDGCQYESVGETLDVGACLRQSFAKLPQYLLTVFAATPALPAETVQGLTDDRIMRVAEDEAITWVTDEGRPDNSSIISFARAILAASGAVPAPALPVAPEGWREILNAELEAQEKHYGEVAACAAAGSRMHMGERDCTEGVILGVQYCINALERAFPAALELPEGNQQPQAIADRDSALHAEPASQHEAIAGAVARGWCAPGCTDIEMDATLVLAITAEVEKLLASGAAAGGDTSEESDDSAFLAHWDSVSHNYGCGAEYDLAYRAARAAWLAAPSLAASAEPDGHMVWHKGAPPKMYGEEWFIAITTYGGRVVLRALPEDYSYDYQTADETYIKRDKIKKWMQFPDSNYIPFTATQAAQQTEQDAARLEFMMEREAWIAWGKDGESCRLFHRNEDGEPMPMLGWGARHWSHDPRAAIDAAILANQGERGEKA